MPHIPAQLSQAPAPAEPRGATVQVLGNAWAVSAVNDTLITLGCVDDQVSPLTQLGIHESLFFLNCSLNACLERGIIDRVKAARYETVREFMDFESSHFFVLLERAGKEIVT